MTISGGTSTLDIPNLGFGRRPSRLYGVTNRNPSADSLLAMFRNMNNNPSPQDSFCSEESLALDTPVSTSSGPCDSPGYGITIEVPVTDSLTAQKAANNFLQPPSIHLEIPSNISKFLSPIREVPTPMASPALTPILPRTSHDTKRRIESSEEDKCIGYDTDDFTENSSELVVEIHHQADDDPSPTPIIPVLIIEEPSPIKEKNIPVFTFSGSPPPQKRESFSYPSPRSPKKYLKELEKPTSLELPHPPPMIMITFNASEGESDPESCKQMQTLNPTTSSAGMSYLSPFSMGSRNDRTASESNLSSSGYSSMASPGPSRCGSNNPLCLSEVEDHGPHGHSPGSRPSPLLRSPAVEPDRNQRVRSDSETLSDDPLLESNDEGIGTDHLEEKVDDGEKLKLQQGFLECVSLPIPPPRMHKRCDSMDTLTSTKTSLQLPTIVVQSDSGEKLLSPVSSRSESPLSEKTIGLGRFSPMFYCKTKSELPFTDSDGLYDFPSSDCPPSKSTEPCNPPQRKRRERRPSSARSIPTGSKSPSPTKGLVEANRSSSRKPSPKRRTRTQAPPSSSSSTESLKVAKGTVSIRLTAPDGTEWPVRSPKETRLSLPVSNEASGEDTAEVGATVLNILHYLNLLYVATGCMDLLLNHEKSCTLLF